MKKTTIIGAVVLLVYMALLPYLSRLPHGVEWAGQYLPDRGHLVSGVLFAIATALVPTAPLVFLFMFRRNLFVTFVVALLAATAATIHLNHAYDLRADAQASLGLLFMPGLAFLLAILVVLTCGPAEMAMRAKLGILSLPDGSDSTA